MWCFRVLFHRNSTIFLNLFSNPFLNPFRSTANHAQQCWRAHPTFCTFYGRFIQLSIAQNCTNIIRIGLSLFIFVEWLNRFSTIPRHGVFIQRWWLLWNYIILVGWLNRFSVITIPENIIKRCYWAGFFGIVISKDLVKFTFSCLLQPFYFSGGT